MLQKEIEKQMLIQRQFNRLARPRGQMHGIGNSQSPDAFPAVCHQRLSAKNSPGKGVHNADVLLVFAVRFHVTGSRFRAGKGRFIPPREHRLRHLQPGQMQRTAVRGQCAAIAHDFKAVRAGRIPGRGNKGSGRAVRVLHVRCHVILHLDVVPFAKVHPGIDKARHTANPLPQIQVMRALIEQNAAALARPRGTPRARIIVRLVPVPVGNNPAGAPDRPQRAGIHDLLHFAVDVICPLIEHHAEHDVGMPVRFLHHLPHLQGVYTRRLLAHDVNARAHRLNRIPGVIVVRNGNLHRINQPGVQHLLRRSEQRDIRLLQVGIIRPPLVQQRPRCLQTGRIGVRHSRNLNFGRASRQRVIQMSCSHVTHAYDTESNLFHARFLPILHFVILRALPLPLPHRALPGLPPYSSPCACSQS